jgi:hypothetical protein
LLPIGIWQTHSSREPLAPVQGEVVRADLAAVATVAGLEVAEDETAVDLEEVADPGAVQAVGLALAVLAVLAVLEAGVLEAGALEGAAEEALVEVVEVVRLLYGKHFR